MSQNRRDTLDSWIPVQTWVVVAPAKETHWHCRTFLISMAQSDWKGIQKLLLKQNKIFFRLWRSQRTNIRNFKNSYNLRKQRLYKFFKTISRQTMASSNHQNRIGQAISLYGLELQRFRFWLNKQDPENIKASLMSIIDHDTNEVSCHVTINWSPNTPDQNTFPIHFRDMRKSTVLLTGGLTQSQ